MKDVLEIARRFDIPEGEITVRPFGNGHINGTYCVEYADRPSRYILQTINTAVFTKPVELMENILAVTGHLRKKITEAGGDPMRETLNLIPLKGGETPLPQDGAAWGDASSCMCRDGQGRYWRMFVCIEGATSYDQVRSRSDFYESALAFGRFQRLLADFPMEKLHETIPGFHNTKARYEALARAAREDVCGRAGGVREEIRYALDQKELAFFFSGRAGTAELPLRVTHNDTKLNNIMMDDRTGKGICVIDLDTVMPGLTAFDFGDAIRFGANTAAEDEKDLARVSLDLDLYRAFLEGFVEGCGGALTGTEIRLLPMGAMEMTYENGIRFLTDYLQGDVYFKVHDPLQNLDRARCQFALLRDMEQKLLDKSLFLS